MSYVTDTIELHDMSSKPFTGAFNNRRKRVFVPLVQNRIKMQIATQFSGLIFLLREGIRHDAGI